MLAERINEGAGRVGLQGAQELFDHLTASGNKAAANRHADILQMYENLGLFSQPAVLSQPQERRLGVEPQPELCPEVTPIPPFQQIVGPDTSSAEQVHIPQYQANSAQHFYSNESFGTFLDHNNMMDAAPNDGSIDVSMWEGSYDIYSCYHNDEFALTGAMDTDWEELQRQMRRYQ